MRDVVQRGLRRASGARIGGRGVQAILQHVQIEAAQVLGAEHLQLGDHRVELVDVVMREDLALQFGRARERVAIDLQPFVDRYRMPSMVVVGQIGEQKAQGVADTAIAFRHALEDFVGDRQFARVVG